MPLNGINPNICLLEEKPLILQIILTFQKTIRNAIFLRTFRAFKWHIAFLNWLLPSQDMAKRTTQVVNCAFSLSSCFGERLNKMNEIIGSMIEDKKDVPSSLKMPAIIFSLLWRKAADDWNTLGGQRQRQMSKICGGKCDGWIN
jgi:hypothetical protein